jgi:hypothetical protein
MTESKSPGKPNGKHVRERAELLEVKRLLECRAAYDGRQKLAAWKPPREKLEHA